MRKRTIIFSVGILVILLTCVAVALKINDQKNNQPQDNESQNSNQQSTDDTKPTALQEPKSSTAKLDIACQLVSVDDMRKIIGIESSVEITLAQSPDVGEPSIKARQNTCTYSAPNDSITVTLYNFVDKKMLDEQLKKLRTDNPATDKKDTQIVSVQVVQKNAPNQSKSQEVLKKALGSL